MTATSPFLRFTLVFATVAPWCGNLRNRMRQKINSNLVHCKVLFDGRPTSLRLEPEFWQYLREIAVGRRVALHTLISVVNQHRGKNVSLASALRVFVAQHYREG